ncbi:uroporphyrinogen-III synthase [Tropicimonas sp.]|uniref:uroporphyrinogen-III synthase n=1 Tax=Tropicimonas sp. TaxID=2067044 RepID=UPI003A8A173C
MNRAETSLLLTRPEPAARRFLGQLQQDAGDFLQVAVSPLQKIVHLDRAGPVPADAGFILTSEHGVSAVEARLANRGRHVWCVGRRTAERARKAGFDVVIVAETAEALTGLILDAAPRRPLVHVAGLHRSGDIVGRLNDAGIAASVCIAYDQQAVALSPAAKDLIAAAGDVVVPSFSPRSTRLLADATAGRCARLHLVAISRAATAGWVPRSGEKLVVAQSPDAVAMVAAVRSLFDADRQT